MFETHRGMKPRTIKFLLRKKIDEWLKSIEDDKLRSKCRSEAMISGGAIASMILGEEVNDFDIYFKTQETVYEVAMYYVKAFQEKQKEQGKFQGAITVKQSEEGQVSVFVSSEGVANDTSKTDHDAGQYITDVMDELKTSPQMASLGDVGGGAEYSPCFISTNAISLRGQIQLVLRFYGDADEIHKNYDFVHCTNYWESGTGELYLNVDALTALTSKTLMYQGSLYPFSSIVRTRKFIGRGWVINAGQYLKMAMQISELDLNNRQVLMDQLTGVDVAYFEEVIAQLQEGGDKIETTMVIDIIDKMF